MMTPVKKQMSIAAMTMVGVLAASTALAGPFGSRGGDRMMHGDGMGMHGDGMGMHGDGMGMHGDGMGMHAGGGMGMSTVFAEIDANQDGMITQEEMDARHTNRVAAMDADGDGFVTSDELSAFHIEQAKTYAGAHADAMIAARDSDGDGKLSAAELMVRKMPANLVSRLDQDGDGALSEDEMNNLSGRMNGGKKGDGRGWMGRNNR